MALTRRFLKALEIDAEKIDEIISEHSATVDALKEQIATYKADAEKLDKLQKELDTAKADLKVAKDDGFKEKYNATKKELDDLIAANAAKETRAAKEEAAQAYFKKNGITMEKALKLAMRSSSAEIEELELGEDGKIKDSSGLAALVRGDLSELVSKTSTSGANTPNPAGTGSGKLTRNEIMKITDRTERRKAIAENLDVFRKGE